MTEQDYAARVRALTEAAQPILDRCLDFFGEDDLDPESSEAMPVVIKNRWVYALREALAAPVASEPDCCQWACYEDPGCACEGCAPAPSEPGVDGAAIAEALRKVLPADVVYALRPTGDPFGEWGRAVLAALAAPAPSEPGLDVDTLVVALSEAVKGVCLAHGIRPTEFLDAMRAEYARLRGGQE